MSLAMLSVLALIALILVKVLHIGQHKNDATQALQDLVVRLN